MYKLCKTERSARRQRQIEYALLDLMTQQPYDTISVTELCEKLVMPRKAFYRYFDSKDDALTALLEHTFAEYESFRQNTAFDGTRSLKKDLVSFFAFWKQQRPLLDAFAGSDLLGRLSLVLINMAGRNAILLSTLLPDESEAVRLQVAKFAACGFISLAVEWYKDGFATSDEEMLALSLRLLAQPLFTDSSDAQN